MFVMGKVRVMVVRRYASRSERDGTTTEGFHVECESISLSVVIADAWIVTLLTSTSVCPSSVVHRLSVSVCLSHVPQCKSTQYS